MLANLKATASRPGAHEELIKVNHARCRHSHALPYISSVDRHRKQTGWHENDLAARGYQVVTETPVHKTNVGSDLGQVWRCPHTRSFVATRIHPARTSHDQNTYLAAPTARLEFRRHPPGQDGVVCHPSSAKMAPLSPNASWPLSRARRAGEGRGAALLGPLLRQMTKPQTVMPSENFVRGYGKKRIELVAAFLRWPCVTSAQGWHGPNRKS